MKPFFKLKSRNQLQNDILNHFNPLPAEKMSLDDALGRVVAEDVISPEDLPPFSRSTMDGFAVNAADTFGASESQPALFEVVGEVAMGESPEGIEIQPGQAARIWTGGELPSGSNAVVMVEYTEAIDETTIEVSRSVAPLENVIEAGEDVGKGQKVLDSGAVLRAQELGILAGLGITSVKAYPVPRVAIISTGDELVPADTQPPRGKIRDINSTTLSALSRLAGANPVNMGIITDNRGGLSDACRKALELPADVVLVSGGSSVGVRDFTLDAFKAVKDAKILAHGVSVKPGKPTILAEACGRALVGLPGHVASAAVVFLLFVYPLLKRMQGFTDARHLGLPCVNARISRNYPSRPGREEYLRVRLVEDESGLVAEPVFGKSGLIYPLSKADGLLVIPRDSEGLYANETAEVLLLP